MSTTDKLKQVTIGEKADNVKAPTAEEREAKIAYLRNLFRLSFRVPTDDHDGTVNWGGFDEAEANDFRESFAALDAVDVYYQLCIDYCEDQLASLKKRMVKHQHNLDAHLKSLPDDSVQIPKQIRKQNQYLLEFYTNFVMNNQQMQKEFAARLATMKQELAKLSQSLQPTKNINAQPEPTREINQ